MKWFLAEVISHTWVDAEGQPVFLFYLTEHLRNGMGWGFEIVAFAGLIYALYRHQTRDWILLAFPLPLLLALAKGENFARYALPLLPFFAIAAARVLNDGAQFARARWATGALVALGIALMIPSARNIARYDFWLTQPDTRAVAAQWIATNIAREARIVIEGAGVLGPPPPAAYSRVETVFRLDEEHAGGMFVRKLAHAETFVERDVAYLVTVSWMQRADQASYSAEFQRSLIEAYAPVIAFAPTIEFRFDPYAWRMDYAALEQIVPGTPGIGGPRITIYRRRGMP